MNAQEAIPAMTDPPPAGDDEVSILIVDDEPGNRETLADIFAEMGYRTESAGTGQQALAEVRERFYNVAILDIRLPDVKGTELLEQIKAVQPQTTCIMVTGYASLETSMRAINSGAYAYIVKPLDIEHVSSVIQQALEQQRLLFENTRLLRRLQALSEVTDTALSTLDLDELLRSLLRSCIHALQADAGQILLVDESGERLEVRAAQGVEELRPGRFSLALGEGFAGRVALQEGPVVVEDVHSSDGVADPSLRTRGIRSMLGVPLRAKERTIGVAHVDCLQSHAFSQDQIDLFSVLAPRAALLIDNTRLYEQARRLHREADRMAITQQRTAQEIRSLYDVAQALVENMGLEDRLTTLAGQLIKVMRVDRCVIWLREGDALVPRTIVGVSEEEKEAWRGVQIEPGQYGPLLQAALDRGEPRVVPAAA